MGLNRGDLLRGSVNGGIADCGSVVGRKGGGGGGESDERPLPC